MLSHRQLNNQDTAEALLRLFNINSSWKDFEDLEPQYEPARSIYQFVSKIDQNRSGELFATDPSLKLLTDAYDQGFRLAYTIETASKPAPQQQGWMLSRSERNRASNYRQPEPAVTLLFIHKTKGGFNAEKEMQKGRLWSAMHEMVYGKKLTDSSPTMEFADTGDEATLTFMHNPANHGKDDYEKYGQYLPALQKTVHPEIPSQNFIFSLTSDTPEHSKPIVTALGYHSSDSAFASMTHKAFGQHYPLELRPDDLHLLIIQGIHRFISQYPEDFRKVLVNFDGKQQAEVTLSDINDVEGWRKLPSAFADVVKQAILVPAFADLLLQEYSQSTEADRVAKAINMMGTFSAYFHYLASTLCHIPQFILKGSLGDWQKLADLPKNIISELQLTPAQAGATPNGKQLLYRWLTRLQPVLDKMLSSRQGNIDAQFWKDFYKFNSESGNNKNAITGNIIYFFPFLKKDNSNNPSFVLNKFIMGDEITLASRPSHLEYGLGRGPAASELTANYVSVDFMLRHLDVTYPMGMKAGIFAHKTGVTDKRVSTHVGYTMFFKNDKPNDMRLLQQPDTDVHARASDHEATAAPASQPVEEAKVEQAKEQPKQREITVRMAY